MGDRFRQDCGLGWSQVCPKCAAEKVSSCAPLRLCTHLTECNFCLICSVVWVHSLDFLLRGSSALLVGILFTICRSTYAPDSRTCCHSARGAHPILRRLRCR